MLVPASQGRLKLRLNLLAASAARRVVVRGLRLLRSLYEMQLAPPYERLDNINIDIQICIASDFT